MHNCPSNYAARKWNLINTEIIVSLQHKIQLVALLLFHFTLRMLFTYGEYLPDKISSLSGNVICSLKQRTLEHQVPR